MEQHLYSYMNKRFGLKNLIVENVCAVLRALQTFSSKDNDIAVFQKILANEIDEEFRHVQQQIKDTHARGLRAADGHIDSLAEASIAQSAPGRMRAFGRTKLWALR